MKRGYERVGTLHGGFDEWIRRNLPTQPKTAEVRLIAKGVSPEGALASNSSA
jgi:3-mercaptopyruvate sulfurtransferase SseA